MAADDMSVVSAAKTFVVSAAKKAATSAATSAVSILLKTSAPEGVVDKIELSDVAADVAAFLAAEITDVLAADATDVLSAAKAAFGLFV